MPPRRLGTTPTDCVLFVDGEEVPAVAGEPVAVALAAAGRLVLGRSVKYHRPRGAACFAGRCDGCLMRVDGVPSKMTCRVPAAQGMRVETQNVLGSATVDLLSATDWFFPSGMNHHEMFTWNKAANRAMQSVARQIAGVGTLPDAPIEAPRPVERDVDVVVVGAGPAGLEVARGCAARGLRTVVVDEESVAGGHLATAPRRARSEGGADPEEAAHGLAREALSAGVELKLRHAAVAVHEPGPEGVVLLADGPDALLRVRARRIVLATGRQEGTWAFPGNDLPGVMGPDAAARLLQHGVLPGRRIVVSGDPDDTSLQALSAALAEAGAAVDGIHPRTALVAARGRTQVTRCDLARDGGTVSVPCDLLIVAAPSSAAYELAAQAGADVAWSGTGFEIDASPADGATKVPWTRVVGAASALTSAAAVRAQAEAAAAALASELAHD